MRGLTGIGADFSCIKFTREQCGIQSARVEAYPFLENKNDCLEEMEYSDLE
jgi:hypothetical protein